MLPLKHSIVITNTVQEYAQSLKIELASYRSVFFIKDKFLLEDAKNLIAEAYKTEENDKYIIAGAMEFNTYSQNALLKVLEEPPKNIIFIIIAPTKTSLIPTIRSRLPIQTMVTKNAVPLLDIDFHRLDLNTIFTFLDTHKNITKSEAKKLVVSLHKTAIVQGVKMNAKQLQNFDMVFRLLELNTRVSTVLALLMMDFLYEN